MYLRFTCITRREEAFDCRLKNLFPALLTPKCFRMDDELGQSVVPQVDLTVKIVWNKHLPIDLIVAHVVYAWTVGGYSTF